MTHQTPYPQGLTQEDESHLKVLSIFHFVAGVLTGLVSLFPIIHLVVGLAMMGGVFVDGSFLPGAFFGIFFVVIALMFIVGGLALAAGMILTGFYLQQHRKHTFCTVVAGIECIIVPLGTVLGVFTIIVLMRENVKAAFGQAPGFDSRIH
jgi:hypothetical protein